MNCDQIRALLSAHLDNELPAADSAQISAHTLSCPDCGAALDGLRRASRAVRELPLKPLPPGFMARLEARRAGSAATTVAWLAPKPLAFAAACAVVVLVVAGPLRSRNLARAPGRLIAGAAGDMSAEPALKTRVDVPPPAPGAFAPEQPAASGNAASAPPAQDAVVPETARMLLAASQSGSADSDAAPAPSAAATAVRGSKAKKAYTNDQLHDMLQKESDELGMQPAGAEPEHKGTSFMGDRLGEPGTREQAEASIRQLAAMRRAVDAGNQGKATLVPIAGSVAPLLGGGGSSAERGGRAFVEQGAITDGFWSGDFAAGNEGTRTIEDAKAWAALWRTLSTAPLPEVDFAQSRVVAIFLGPRPTGGYAVEISELKRTARQLLVRWREQAPAPGQSPRDGATSPYALRVIPRSDQPVRFEKTR